MAGLTAQIAEYVAGPAPELSPDVLRTVRTGFVDTVGVMVAGAAEPVTAVVRNFVQAGGSQVQQASILLGVERASSRNAALVNATAAHALDYDDVGLMGHPSAVLVPALLAEGERLRASGLALMQAYVKGYEVWGELIARDRDQHHAKGWHPTAVFGVVAVAAAVAALRQASPAQAQNAIGIAASSAAGVIANFGTMTKPFHAGQASAHGIDAVNLAQAGLTAAPDAIEHSVGFLAALSPAGNIDLSPRDRPLQETSRIATIGLTVKKYPMCFATHRVIDGVLDLAREHRLDASAVRNVRASIGVTQAAMLRNHDPRTGLEAKFSLEFAIAVALVARKLGLSELQDSFVLREDVRALMRKVEITTVDTVCPHEPSLAASDRVIVQMEDGRHFDSGEIEEARGGMSHPLLDGELEAKFMDCMAGSRHDAARLYGQLQWLETLDEVILR
jgi:2-methylcitrate dehydratase PrpD